MTEPVVDPLEPVEVDQGDGTRHIAALGLCDFFLKVLHDAAPVERAGEFVEFGEFFDLPVGFLQFQAAPVKGFMQRTAEQPDDHSAAEHESENQHGREPLKQRAVRHSNGLVRADEQNCEANGRRRPSKDGLAERGAQGGEGEGEQDRAEEQAADFRRQIQKRQHDGEADAGLLYDEIVVPVPVVHVGFRRRDEEGDGQQSAESVSRSDPERGGPREGVDQQNSGIDQKADADHVEHLPPLPFPADDCCRRQGNIGCEAHLA